MKNISIFFLVLSLTLFAGSSGYKDLEKLQGEEIDFIVAVEDRYEGPQMIGVPSVLEEYAKSNFNRRINTGFNKPYDFITEFFDDSKKILKNQRGAMMKFRYYKEYTSSKNFYDEVRETQIRGLNRNQNYFDSIAFKYFHDNPSQLYLAVLVFRYSFIIKDTEVRLNDGLRDSRVISEARMDSRINFAIYEYDTTAQKMKKLYLYNTGVTGESLPIDDKKYTPEFSERDLTYSQREGTERLLDRLKRQLDRTLAPKN